MKEQAVENKELKVSVCVVTYNQEKYIRECLQSLVDQQCDFEFEIIVGDDASEDETPKIIEEYAKKYPKIIFPIFRSENIGPLSNAVDLYKRAKGKFIAHMDGDDFALEGKLQKQFRILEDNNDCVICSHDVHLVDEKSRKYKKSMRHSKFGVNSLMDLYARLPFFAHSSKMFLNKFDGHFYEGLNSNAIDIEIHIAQARCGSIYHINSCLGAYRMMTGMSYVSGGINPLLSEAVHRVFKEALFNSDMDNYGVEILKKNYAEAMLSCAYHSAWAGVKNDYIRYTRESFNIKIFSVVQIIMYGLTVLPDLAIFFAHLRRRFSHK